MAQITWRNVNGPSLADASRPLEAAQRSFGMGFDQLGDIVRQREALDAQNQVVQRNNNTASYLDQVAALGQSPEALQEAMKSGAIARLRAGFGQNIDADRVRGAAENVLSQRYQQVMQANQYGDQQRDRTEAPIMDQIASLTAQGKRSEALALLDQHQLRNEAKLYAGVDERGQVEVNRTRDTTRFGWAGDEHKWQGQKIQDDLLTNASQRAASAASIAAAAENRAASKEQREFNREDRTMRNEQIRMAAQAKLRAEAASLNDNLLSSEDGAKAVQATISQVFKDPDTHSLARAAIAKLAKIPGMTAGVASQALSGMEDIGWLNTDSGLVNGVVSRAQAIMEGSDFKSKQARNAERLAGIMTNMADLEQYGKVSGTKLNTKPAKSGGFPIEEVSEVDAERMTKALKDRVNKQYKNAK